MNLNYSVVEIYLRREIARLAHEETVLLSRADKTKDLRLQLEDELDAYLAQRAGYRVIDHGSD